MNDDNPFVKSSIARPTTRQPGPIEWEALYRSSLLKNTLGERFLAVDGWAGWVKAILKKMASWERYAPSTKWTIDPQVTCIFQG